MRQDQFAHVVEPKAQPVEQYWIDHACHKACPFNHGNGPFQGTRHEPVERFTPPDAYVKSYVRRHEIFCDSDSRVHPPCLLDQDREVVWSRVSIAACSSEEFDKDKPE